jgi:cell shape-determining protein MreC
MYFWKTTMISPNPFDRSQKNRRRSPWTLRIFLIAVALAFCVVGIVWQNFFAGMLWQIGAPVLGLRNQFSQTQVSLLEAQLASTSAALADRDALYDQNIELKKMLGRPQTSTQVLGAVLLRPPGLPYDTLMIDIGAQNEVVAGDIVFAGGTAAIGEITNVYPTTSRVSLFSAPGRTYDAQVSSKGAIGVVTPISLQGQGAGSLSGEVPAGSNAAVGDSVVVPGLGNYFVGQISHIDAPSGSSFETLYVQMPVDIFSLKYVQVQTHI